MIPGVSRSPRAPHGGTDMIPGVSRFPRAPHKKNQDLAQAEPLISKGVWNMIKKLGIAASLVAIALLVPGLAFAAEEAAKAPASSGAGWGHFSAAIAIGLAAACGALGQARAADSACDGIARNPGATGQIRGMAFLALVLIESLVIYALVIAFVVQGK